MSPVLLVTILAVVALVLGALILIRARHRRAVAPAGRRSAVTASAPDPSTISEREPRTSGGGFHAEGLGTKVRALFGRHDTDAWAELEHLLLKADVGPAGARDLVARVKDRSSSGADPTQALRDEMLAVLGPDEPLHLPKDRLGVILVVGVNGSGKTTTIGKLASRLAAQGSSVSIAAADTFRAAAGEQLEVWADRSGAHLISQERGADPGSVAFDAVRSSTARGTDALIVDTAGRLHTKQPLMEELAKIKRVIEKAGAQVDEALLVLDAQTGQNGIVQARAFTEAVTVTGVVLTKTDGSARGGVVLAVREELGVPVRFVGVGEGVDDLRPFDAGAFVDRLMA